MKFINQIKHLISVLIDFLFFEEKEYITVFVDGLPHHLKAPVTSAELDEMFGEGNWSWQ